MLGNIVFPPLCLHCEERLDKGGRLICKACASFFELIDPETRCPYCFTENGGSAPCCECVEKRRWGLQVGAALEYFGPVATFVKKMKRGGMPYLAKTGGAFLFGQFQTLGWPMPDLLIPIPRRSWLQGTNHATLLALSLGKLLGVPVREWVKRTSGDLSQARLSSSQREALAGENFFLKKKAKIEGKVILIIDDVRTTGTTLRCTAQALKEGFPKRLYALTLARAGFD